MDTVRQAGLDLLDMLRSGWGPPSRIPVACPLAKESLKRLEEAVFHPSLLFLFLLFAVQRSEFQARLLGFFRFPLLEIDLRHHIVRLGVSGLQADRSLQVREGLQGIACFKRYLPPLKIGRSKVGIAAQSFME